MRKINVITWSLHGQFSKFRFKKRKNIISSLWVFQIVHVMTR